MLFAKNSFASKIRFSLRLLKAWWQRKYVAHVDHAEVVRSVCSEGRLTSRYSFMVTMSCAIAILGLLLSSPAVVIGAMLISPLMAPIIALGFSLCLLDFHQMRKALEALVVGVALALAISWLIVTLSPLTDATPEIMARTRPNLFDLLVAIFSGMAGGYAVIKRKGETIVGVAIATALMPPLAVIGFGLATGSAAITKGAFMLFMTNLLAISLSVTLLTKFYGFSPRYGHNHTALQMLLIIGVFVGLSLPLGVALRDIAYQTYVTKMAKNTIKKYFDNDDNHISMFNIYFSKGDDTRIETVVLTPNYRSGARTELTKMLSDKIGKDVILSLDQVVLTRDTIKEAEQAPVAETTTAAALQPPPPQQTRTEEITAALKQAASFAVDYIKVDAEAKTATLYPKQGGEASLASLRQFEESLSGRYPGWNMWVVPPFQALPYVYYASGSTKPDELGSANLVDILWALRRWEAHEVKVIGFTTNAAEARYIRDSSLAIRRARVVADTLKASGIASKPTAEYRSSHEWKKEEKSGVKHLRAVEIRLDPASAVSSVEIKKPAAVETPSVKSGDEKPAEAIPQGIQEPSKE